MNLALAMYMNYVLDALSLLLFLSVFEKKNK